jgi:tetratricopeptide (TPR) repeat protein
LNERQKLEQLAYRLESTNQWSEAASVLSRLVDREPGAIQTSHRYGLSLIGAGDYRQGIEQLTRVVREGKATGVTWHSLGHAYGELGSYDEALDAFKKAIRLEPANSWHYLRGASLIADAARVSPGFQRYIPLASEWTTRAGELGASQENLRPIRSMLSAHVRYGGQPYSPSPSPRRAPYGGGRYDQVVQPSYVIPVRNAYPVVRY